MLMTYKRQESKGSLPVITLAEAKMHLRVDGSDEDSLISTYILAATGIVEAYLRRVVTDAEWKFYFDGFPSGRDTFVVPASPVVEVQQFRYRHPSSQVLTDILAACSVEYVDGPEPGQTRIRLTDLSASWPATDGGEQAVELEVRLGYRDGLVESPPPDAIKVAVLLMVGNLYANREPVITGTIAAELPMSMKFLLSPYRNFEFK